MDYEERLKYAQGIYAEGLRKVATEPAPPKQKYPKGSFVYISKASGPAMRHFQSDTIARVEYTYAHAYGGDNVDSYSLLVRYPDGKWSRVAWYREEQLELVTDPKIIKKLKAECTPSPPASETEPS